MLKVRSVKFNFLMNAILTASSILFPLITFPYVSRILMADGTGKVSFASSVIAYFTIFAQMGIPTYGIRACSRVRDDHAMLSKTVQELLIINLIMNAAIYVFFGISLEVVPRFSSDRCLFVIMGSTMLFNCLGVEWMYRGLERYGYITACSLIFKIIAVAAMFILVREKSDYVAYGLVTIIGTVGSNICNILNLRRYVTLRKSGQYELRKHIKPILIFFMMSVAVTIYTNLDTVMLGFIKTDSDVGYYNAAVKVRGLLVNFVATLGNVLLPRASYYIENKLYDDFKRISLKAMNFVLVVAVPLVLYFMFFAKESIMLLSGKNFDGAIIPMIVIMPTILLVGMTNIIGIQMLVPLGCEKKVLGSEIAGAIVDVIINILLIPIMASTGAAIGTVLAELAVFVYQYVAIRKQGYKVIEYNTLYKTLLASVIAAGNCIGVMKVLTLIPGLNTVLAAGHEGSALCILLITAAIFAIVYIGLLVVLKEKMTKEIIYMIKDKISNIKH